MNPRSSQPSGSSVASRIDRRTVLGLIAGTATAGLAGCVGGDGSDGDSDGDDGDDDGDATDGGGGSSGTQDGDDTDGSGDGSTSCPGSDGGDIQDPGVAQGTVVSNAIEELEVVGLESSIVEQDDGNEYFELAITVKNNSDQEENARDYTYSFTLYDSSCAELAEPGITQYGLGGMDPGGEATVFIKPGAMTDIDPHNIAYYGLTVDCSGPFAEGTFCPDESE